MKILILCDLFPPAFGPRMGYLCKYLRRAGWEPTVITEHVPGGTFDFLKEEAAEVIRIRCYRARGRFLRALEWGCIFLLDVLSGYKDRRMYRAALEQTRKHAYRLVLCSTYRTFPLPAARRIARKAGLPLVADLRDMVEQVNGHEFITHSLPGLWGLGRWMASAFLRRGQRQRNRVLRDAACITSVSPWHVALLKSYRFPAELIYNGYDPELFYPAPVRSERFYITYTGRVIYAGRTLNRTLRDPELLFQAVAELAKKQLITPETFCVRWFTDEKSQQFVRQEAERYALTEYMALYGCVPAPCVPALLNESAVLLVLTNKTGEQGPKGVMTTKFFEALAVEKPVLCVRGDEGCLEDVISRTRTGLSAHRTEEVCRFIEMHYRQWQATGLTTVDTDREEVGKFSREAQAGRFIRIFEQITRINSQ
ncbi:MAG: glycosyltransferase [Tannerella sp.]|jgi:glycosyltransferase involved in cell wall biosynthesis|nr:glycosyltransferase [Tannerella sp.]